MRTFVVDFGVEFSAFRLRPQHFPGYRAWDVGFEAPYILICTCYMCILHV